MSKQRQKGTAYENKVRDMLNNGGIKAERSPQLTHAKTNPELDADVVIGSLDKPYAKVECKYRKSVPKSVYDWLDGNNFLFMKKIGREYDDLVVMDADTFMEMYWIAFPHLRTEE